jgi:hypothetical protein
MSELRNRLEDLRDRLEVAMQTAEPRELPALGREYRATLAELEALPSETKRTTLDELRAKRAARKSDPADLSRPASG